MEQLKELGRAIKQKRLAENLTMDYLASKANISRATLWSIEKGNSNCSIKAVFKILDLLGLSISINNQENDNTRERAQRLNTSYDKKTNRFLIMCIEEYASSLSISSGAAYKSMKEKGVIESLKNDYEDLHGYSQSYINDYISSLMEDKK